MFCASCGKESLPGKVFCMNCGARLQPAPAEQHRSSETGPAGWQPSAPQTSAAAASTARASSVFYDRRVKYSLTAAALIALLIVGTLAGVLIARPHAGNLDGPSASAANLADMSVGDTSSTTELRASFGETSVPSSTLPTTDGATSSAAPSSTATTLSTPTSQAPTSTVAATSTTTTSTTVTAKAAATSSTTTTTAKSTTTTSTTAPPAAQWYIRLYNIDDRGTAYVNSSKVAETGYGQGPGWIDVTSYFISGNNKVRFTLWNDVQGYTWGFAIRRNESVVWQDVQGQVGVVGANNNDYSRTYSMVYDQTISVDNN